LEACKKVRNRQGNCKVGEAVFINAGKLKAKMRYAQSVQYRITGN